jgi:hypothetical protein
MPGWDDMEGLAWISSTILPMITGLGSSSTTVWLLNGFCNKGKEIIKKGKEKSRLGGNLS